MSAELRFRYLVPSLQSLQRFSRVLTVSRVLCASLVPNQVCSANAFTNQRNYFIWLFFGHLILGFETALTNEPYELRRMWKINSSTFQRNTLTVNCCCGRNNCTEPRTGSTKTHLAPFLHLNRKLCKHVLRNKVESSEIWTLLNPRDGGTESAFLVFSISEEYAWKQVVH